MRVLIAVLAAALAGCNPTSYPAPKPDPTKQASYVQAVAQLNDWFRDAESLREQKKNDDASALLLKAQPVISEVLSVPNPSLAAMQIASDLDDLYGRMLLSNRHFGSARLMFQKNVSRWTHWRPQTEETARRRQIAEEAIRECDRRIERQ